MSEISEEQAREAALSYEECNRKFFAGELLGMKSHEQFGNAASTLIEFAKQELARRDATQAAGQQLITPEWCIANGAKFCEPYYVFEDPTRLMLRLLGHASLVFVNGQMLDWSATCVGQVEDLRKALRGVAT